MDLREFVATLPPGVEALSWQALFLGQRRLLVLHGEVFLLSLERPQGRSGDREHEQGGWANDARSPCLISWPAFLGQLLGR
jgi:hypothetical protein